MARPSLTSPSPAAENGAAVARFRVLGPVEMAIGSRATALPPTKPSIVLAALLLHANTPVPVERLLDAVWGPDPPASAAATLQTHVLRLRRAFRDHGAPGPVRTVPGGYLLEATENTLDLITFRGYVAQARRSGAAGDHEAELHHLGRALDLWRGPALTNIRSEVLQREDVPRLVEERLTANERRVEVALVLGRHHDLVPELRSLTAAHPLRERFWEQLVALLYRLGRQAEALEECRRIRSILADDLGLGPGPDLRRLEREILRGEPPPGGRSTAGPAVVTADPPSQRAPGRCELPPEVNELFGRADLAARLTGDLVGRQDRPAPTLAIVHGVPGVGKTALTLHVAHRLRPRFPGGQWYVRLTDPYGRPREPDDVLRELARTGGSDPDPDRPVLLVLDGATSVAQMHALGPGITGDGVLVTSRVSLASLTALWGARSYRVDPLPPADAVDLLAHLLGEELVRAEPATAREFAVVCGGLPLALRIAAVKFRDHWPPDRAPALPGGGEPGPYGLAGYVGWLRQDTLSKLCIGTDRLCSVREGFDDSFSQLSPAGRRLFMCFAADDPGREMASLPNGNGDHHGGALEELLETSMIRLAGSGTYSMPPLLRRYAWEKAQEAAA